MALQYILGHAGPTEPVPSSSNADDTLEEIEYVTDRGLNYIPKRLINEFKSESGSEPVKKEVKTESGTVSAENENESERAAGASTQSDDEVIVIDSSPENSFGAATDCFKSAFGSNENTFYTAKSILNNVSVVSIDSDSSDEQSSTSQESAERSTIESTIEQTQTSENREEMRSASKIPEILVGEISEASTCAQIDNSVTSTAGNGKEMPNFNDSLDRIEYMMEQAQKMKDDKVKKCAPLQGEMKKSPVSQTKLKPKVLTPNSAALKAATPKHLTPNNGDLFKRPDQRIRSPFTGKAASASKVQPPQIQSRIPTKISSAQKPQFRHIASPIAAYIKNTAEVPLLKTIKPMRNLLTEDFNKVCKPSPLDESTQGEESAPTKSALPRKMYISAPQRKVSVADSLLSILP